MSGAHSAEMFSPTPMTLSLSTMLAASSYDRNSHPVREHITVAIDVHTAFLHADVDPDLFAEPPEPDEWYDAALRDDEVWKLNKALYGYRKAPKLWHQHLVSILESLNCHPFLANPSCFRNDELNINIFIHVDDGLVRKLKFRNWLSFCQNKSSCGSRDEWRKTGRQNLLSRQSDRENGSWILGGGESEVHPIRDCRAWSGRLETSVDSEREEDANDRVTGRAGD